jgi:hypothetical protein
MAPGLVRPPYWQAGASFQAYSSAGKVNNLPWYLLPPFGRMVHYRILLLSRGRFPHSFATGDVIALSISLSRDMIIYMFLTYERRKKQ